MEVGGCVALLTTPMGAKVSDSMTQGHHVSGNRGHLLRWCPWIVPATDRARYAVDAVVIEGRSIRSVAASIDLSTEAAM